MTQRMEEMDIVGEVTIRRATQADLPAIVKVEERWKREPGTLVMGIEELTAWLEEDSPYFLVAEKEGEVTGYYFGVQTDFSIDDFEAFLKRGRQHGYWNVRHNPNGNTMYGISMASIDHSGSNLLKYITQKMRNEEVAHYIAISRLSGLKFYVEKTLKGNLSVPLHDVAVWYACRSAELEHARVWEGGMKPPKVTLPDPSRSDGVLGFHLRHSESGLLALVPDFMPDKKSCNYGVLIASACPHIKVL